MNTQTQSSIHPVELLEWEGPHFSAALSQFNRAADVLNLNERVRQRLTEPLRSLFVTAPIRLDDGRVKNFMAYRVHHNAALGPTIGTLRLNSDVSLGRITSIAMLNSWRCSVVGLPFGGAAGGVAVNPKHLTRDETQRLIRRYISEIVNFIGPESDIHEQGYGTGEREMAWVMDTYSTLKGYSVPSICTGKPVAIGGTVGRQDAQGRGGVYLLMEAAREIGLSLNEHATVAVQGFGRNGSNAARMLASLGCKIIAATDEAGGVFRAGGIDIEDLTGWVERQGTVRDYPQAEPITDDGMFALKADVIIAAAGAETVTAEHVRRLNCRVFMELATNPCSQDAMDVLHQRKDEIFLLPDFLAGAGGTVLSYFEWVQGLQSFFWNTREVHSRLRQILAVAYERVSNEAHEHKLDMRTAALVVAVRRVMNAMHDRGLL